MAGNVSDPTGRSHRLVPAPGSKEAQSETKHFWDYCVPPEVQAQETLAHPGSTKTVHFNCNCAERSDVLDHYLHDPLSKDPDAADNPEAGIDINRVPFNDRITIEAMAHKRAHPEDTLCRPTESSGGFYVCPVSKSCGSSVAKNFPGSAGRGGASPSNWFTGVGGKSWDFCVPRQEDEPLPPVDANASSVVKEEAGKDHAAEEIVAGEQAKVKVAAIHAIPLMATLLTSSSLRPAPTKHAWLRTPAAASRRCHRAGAFL